MQEIKKAIIPISTLNAKFLPLSRIFPKAACPIVDKPIIHYLAKEAKEAQIEEIVFIIDSPKNNAILEYFSTPKNFGHVINKDNKEEIAQDLEEVSEITKDIKITVITQTKPMGSGHAILQAIEKTSDAPAAVLYSDFLIDSTEPCIGQLMKIFNTSQKPILGLTRITPEQLNSDKHVDVEQIAKRVFKIKTIAAPIEPYKNPPEFGIIGRYIFTPEFFDYLKREKNNLKENSTLFDVLNKMLADGKNIYGYEFEGKLLECDNKTNWIKTNIYYSLKDQHYGPEIKNFIKDNKLIN